MSRFKRDWNLLLSILFIQALFGSIILISNTEEFERHNGGLAIIYFYIPLVFIINLISLLIILFLLKEKFKFGIKITLLSFIMWFVLPLFYFKIRTEVKKIDSSKYKQDALVERKRIGENIKQKSIDVAKQLGLKSYSWNPNISKMEMMTENKKLHTFVMNENILSVDIPIDPPQITDTLSWLKLTLNESSSYLERKYYEKFDSCIRNRNFGYKYYNLPDSEPYVISINLCSNSLNSIIVRAEYNSVVCNVFHIYLNYGVDQDLSIH